MKVEIWSDVVCPWCYVGKRHFEAALLQFSHADQVSIEWKSFELDPRAPTFRNMTMDEMLQRKYGMTEEQAVAANQKMTALAAGVGLDFHLDKAQMGNTFDAHRLMHLATRHGLGGALKERLFAAYFTEGRSIGEPAALQDLAVEVGLDPAEVETTLAEGAYASDVRRDEARARTIGVCGVPFFLIDERFAVAGAQPAAVLVGALRRAWAEAHPIDFVDASGDGADPAACARGSCGV